MNQQGGRVCSLLNDMRVRKLGIALWCCSFVVVLALHFPIAARSEVPSHLYKGQSLTLLPSGLVLLAGGYSKPQIPTPELFVADTHGNVNFVPVKMAYPRAGHTATVLPDGHILIFGGYGVDGKLVSTGELFDPASDTISIIDGFRLLPRAFHTSTLLTDGNVVVIGGVGAGGELVVDVQVWDYRTGKTLAYNAGLSVPRQQHTATLLPSGNVQIVNGQDRFGKATDISEEYDPTGHRFSISTSSSSTEIPTIEESIPLDGATDVQITGILSLRFGSQMSVQSLNSRSITLQDSNGNSIQATVTGAETGRLVFVMPRSPLQFGTTYLFTLNSVTDAKGNELPTKTIRFTTMIDPEDASDEEWVPGPGDFNGQWHSHTGPSEWQKLPALQAKAGVTALSGQVLRVNGLPLKHVLLQVDGKREFSDATGRFLIPNIHGGHQVMVIDGTTANRSRVSYGLFEVGIDVIAGKTNVLNYTIWMSKLDMEHAVNIPSPTTAIDTVITSPLLPGLELHLPQDTVISDHTGRAVHQLSITPVPLDKPPFPLPTGVAVPIYFTIQPGGAYIDVRGYASGAQKGARLVYPNAYHSAPGTPFNFWNYDADSKGWYIYGHGKVASDAMRVVPDPGVVIYEFTGAMVGDAGGPFPFDPNNKKCEDGCEGGVDLSTGNFGYSDTDVGLPDVLPIDLTRTYRTNDSVSRAFGIGTTSNYDIYMTGDIFPYTYQELIQADGSRVRFNRISPGTSYSDAFYTHTSAQDEFYGAAIPGYNSVSNSFGGLWVIQQNDGKQIYFPDSESIPNYRQATPLAMTDRYGNKLVFSRNPNGDLLQVTSHNGKYIRFTYDPADRITHATDNLGRTVSYTYDSAGRLATVTDTNGGVKSYTYDSQNNLLTVTDARGIVTVSNQYDASGRVVQQTQADGNTYLFSWTPTQNTSQVFQVNDPTGASAGGVLSFRACTACSEGYTPVIAQVDITDPRGYINRVVFDSQGRKASETFALGQPEQETYAYQYNADNTLASTTDPLGHQTKLTYDARGNLTQLDELAETSSPVTNSYSYDSSYSRTAAATDPLGHSVQFSVDGTGNTTQTLDALGNVTSFTYNEDGSTATMTDAMGGTFQFSYQDGVLASITDPLGRQKRRFVDAAGRTNSVLDPAGNITSYQYDSLSRVTKVTDAMGNSTTLAYDPNGSLTRVTDASNHSTEYVYDNMNRLISRTDPRNRVESYTYDPTGRVLTFTDRNGQVTTYTYNGLRRLAMVGFGTVESGTGTTYADTITYSYDARGRWIQASDVLSGSVNRTYDAFDRITGESTSTASISYAYDVSGRRISMQVLGQPPITYSYDNASRLTSMSQASKTMTVTYDGDGRRSTLTLPNGIVTTYSYNRAGELTGIVYTQDGQPLGDLQYTYDTVGQRTGVAGSMARTNFPRSVSSATYDEGNSLTSWDGQAILSDANGNILSDGFHTYSWDARNHLVAVDSGTTAAFSYDALGRRAAKAVNGVTTNVVYSFINPVQEITGGTVSANFLTGGVDEYFVRSDAQGDIFYLADALGSTLGLADINGNIQTQYTYDPFGATTSTGLPTSNTVGFTGREMDNTGLYYYRARYYEPSMGRFLSEDPIGFKADMNVYAYAFSSPVNFVDPSGLNGTKKPDNAIYKICCKKGKFSFCEGPNASMAGNDWVGDCAREHERQHINDFNSGKFTPLTNCADPANDGQIVNVNGPDKNAIECSGYSKEVDCLSHAPSRAGDSIDARKKFVNDQKSGYCGAAGGCK